MSGGRQTTARERALYMACGAIVVGVAGGALALDLAGTDDPHPRVEARTDGAGWPDGEARAVPWVVENVSGHDIEAVQVEVSLGDGEVVSYEVDYLPGGVARRGVAHLVGDGDPTVRVTGYRLP